MVNSGSYENSTGGEGDSVKGDFTQLENNVTSTAASPRHIVGACAREDEFTAATAEMIVSPKDANEDDLKTESATDPNATERDKDRLKDTYTSLLNLDIIKDNDISNQSETKTSLHCSVPLHKVKDVLNNFYTTQSNFILENLLLKKTNDNKNTADVTDTQKSPKRLLCLFCDRTFQTLTLKQKHVDRCHSSGQSRRSSRTPGSNQSATTCNYCSKLNNTENTWTQVFEHLATEHSNRYFGCLNCQERFSKKQHLQEHNKNVHNIEEVKIVEKRPEEPAIMPDEDHPSKTPSPELSKTRKKNVKNLKPNEIETKSEPDESTSDTEIVKRITRSLKNAPTPTPTNKNRKKIISVKSTKNGVRNKIRTRRAAAIALKQINSELIKLRNDNKKRNQNKPTKTAKKDEVKTETESPKNEVTNSSSVFSLVNLFTYKYEKIYDHSSDSIRDANSGKFDVVFDRDFYTRTVNNIQENLLLYLDGKLNRNIQSENRISNFESDTESKTAPSQETNFGCDISLNAVTPVATLLSSSQYGEDFDAQIEYASKPTQKKTKKDKTVVYKFPNRKYNSLYRERGDHSDLTCLDMWTQLMVKEKQHHENDPTSTKETSRKQIDELNSILDKRGNFDDLRSEQQAAIEENNKSRKNSLEKITNEDVTIILNDILSDVFKTVETEEIEVEEIDEKPVIAENMDLELPNYLNLQISPSKSKKPDDSIDEWVELSGEWARPKIYICATCAQKLPNYKALDEHKNVSHPNIWSTHYEFVGKQSEFYKHLGIPGLGKVGVVEMMPATKYWQRSDARLCSKCAKQCNSLSELHRHMLDCGGDWTWMLARKKLKYRPYGARTRRRRQRGYKRTINPDIPRAPREPKSKPAQVGPRQKPSDAETIERMLANLPAKRIRKVISMRDGIQGPRKPYIRKIAATTAKLQNDKPNQNVTNKNSTLRLINSRIAQTNNQKLKQKIVRTLRSRNSMISEEIKNMKEDTEDKNVPDNKKKVVNKKVLEKKMLEKKILEQKIIEQKIEKKLQNKRAINRILSSKILDTSNTIRTRRRLHKTLIQNNFIRRTRLRSRLFSIDQHNEEETPNEDSVEESTEEATEETKQDEGKNKKTAGKRLLSLISSKPKKKLKLEANKQEESDGKNRESEEKEDKLKDQTNKSEKKNKSEEKKIQDKLGDKKSKLGLKRNKLGMKKKKLADSKNIFEGADKLDENKDNLEENKGALGEDKLNDVISDEKTLESNEKENKRSRKVKSPASEKNKNNEENSLENTEQLDREEQELSDKKIKKSDKKEPNNKKEKQTTDKKEITKKEPHLRDTISEIIDAVAKNTIDNDDTPLSKMIRNKTSKLVENVKSLKKGFKKKASAKIANKLKEKTVTSKLIRTLSMRGSKKQKKGELDKSPGRKKKKVEENDSKNDREITNETTGPKNGDIIPDRGETLLKENVCVALEKLHIDETESNAEKEESIVEKEEESITGKEESADKENSAEDTELKNKVTKNKEDFEAMPTLEKFEPLPENLPLAESIPVLSPVYEKSTPISDKNIEIRKEKKDADKESGSCIGFDKVESNKEKDNEKQDKLIEKKEQDPTNFIPGKDSENPVSAAIDKSKPSAFSTIKNKFKRTGKGLNDCIAMLKCKLEMKSDAPATDLIVLNTVDEHGPLVVENPKVIEKNEDIKNEVIKRNVNIVSEVTADVAAKLKEVKSDSGREDSVQEEPEDLSNHKMQTQRQKVEIIIQQIEPVNYIVDQDEILDLSKKSTEKEKVQDKERSLEASNDSVGKQMIEVNKNSGKTTRIEESKCREDQSQKTEIGKDTVLEVIKEVIEKQKPEVEKRKRGRKSKSKLDSIDSVSKTEEIVQKINEIVQRNEEMFQKVDENIRMSEERSDSVQIEEPTEKAKKKRGRKPKTELEKKPKEKPIKLKLPKMSPFENSSIPDDSKSIDERVDKENIGKGEHKQKSEKIDKKQADNRQVMDDNRQKVDERQKIEHATVLEIPTFTRNLVPTPEPPGEKIEIIQEVQLNPITSVLDAAMKNCLLECVKSKCEELKLIPDAEKERKITSNDIQNTIPDDKQNDINSNERQEMQPSLDVEVNHTKIISDEEQVPIVNSNKEANRDVKPSEDLWQKNNEEVAFSSKEITKTTDSNEAKAKKPRNTPKIIRKIGSVRKRKNKQIDSEPKPVNVSVEPKTLNDAFIEENPSIGNIEEDEVKHSEKSKGDSSDDDIPLSTFVKPKFSKRPALKIKFRKKRRNKLNASPVIRRRRKKVPTLDEKLEQHIELDNSINNRIELIQSEIARSTKEVVDKNLEASSDILSVKSDITSVNSGNVPNSEIPSVQIIAVVALENTEDLPVNLESVNAKNTSSVTSENVEITSVNPNVTTANLFTPPNSDITPTIQPEKEIAPKINPERNLLSPIQEPDVNEIKTIEKTDTETESDPNKTPKRKRNKSITEISESIDSLLESSKLKSSTPNEIATVPKIILTSLPLQLMNIEDEPEICLTDKTLTESNMEPIILEATKFPGNERLEAEVSQMDSGKENSMDKRKRILKKQKRITKKNKGRKKRSIIQLENGENAGSDLVTEITELNDSTLPLIKSKHKRKVTSEINNEISKLGDIITKEMILSDESIENKSDRRIDEKSLNDQEGETKSLSDEKSSIDKSVTDQEFSDNSLNDEKTDIHSLICQRVVDKSLVDDASTKLLIRKDKSLIRQDFNDDGHFETSVTDANDKSSIDRRSDKKLEKIKKRNSKRSKSHSDETAVRSEFEDRLESDRPIKLSLENYDSPVEENLNLMPEKSHDKSRKRLPKIKINTKFPDHIDKSFPLTFGRSSDEKNAFDEINIEKTISDAESRIFFDDKPESEIAPQVKKRRGRRSKTKTNNGDNLTSNENLTLNESFENEPDLTNSSKTKNKYRGRTKRPNLKFLNKNTTSSPLQDIDPITPLSDSSSTTEDNLTTPLSAVIDSITSSLDDEISGNETDKSEIISRRRGRSIKKLSDSDASIDDVTKIFDEISENETDKSEISPQARRKGRIIKKLSDSDKETSMDDFSKIFDEISESETDKSEIIPRPVDETSKSDISFEILTETSPKETSKSNRRGRTTKKSESFVENMSKFDEISESETDKSDIPSSPLRPQSRRRGRGVRKLSESDKETSVDDLTKIFDDISGSETDRSDVLTPPSDNIKPQVKRRRRTVKKLSESDLDTSVDDLSKILDFDEICVSEIADAKSEFFVSTPDNLPSKPDIPSSESYTLTSDIRTPTAEISTSDILTTNSVPPQVKRRGKGVKKSGMKHKKSLENGESDVQQKISEDDETDTSDINTEVASHKDSDIDFIIPQTEHIPKNIKRRTPKDQKKLRLSSLLFQKASELNPDELSSPEVNENEISLHKSVSKRGRKKKNPEIPTDKNKPRKRRSKTDSESSIDNGALISDISKEINEVIKIVSDNSIDVNLSDKMKLDDDSVNLSDSLNESLMQNDLLKDNDDLSETDSKIESIEEFSNIAEKLLDVLDQDEFQQPKNKQRRRRSKGKQEPIDEASDLENKNSDDFEFAPPLENVKKSKSRKRRSKGLDEFVDSEVKTDFADRKSIINDIISGEITKNGSDVTSNIEDITTNSEHITSNSEMISNILDPILPDNVPNIFDEIPKTPNIIMGSDESEDEIPLSFIAKTIGQNIDEDVLNDFAENLETPSILGNNDIVLNEDESLGTVERNLEKAAKLLEDKNLIDDLDKIDESVLDISYDIVNSRDETVNENDLQNSKDLSSDFITSPDMNNKSLVIKIQKKFNVKVRKNNKKPRKRFVKQKVETVVKKPEIEVDASDIFCDICNRTFRRAENLIKHKRTLTHISKLSEIEAKENAARQNALREEEMKNKEKDESDREEEVSKVEEEILEGDKNDNLEVDQGSDLEVNEEKESDQENDLDEDEEADEEEDQLKIDGNKKCDLEEDENKPDKKELEDIEQNVDTVDLIVSEKVPRNFQNVTTENSNLKLADIINNVLDKPVNDLNMTESELISKNISNSIQMVKKQPKRYKSLGERKSFDSDSYTLIPQQSPTENDFTAKQTTNQLLTTQLSLLENIIEKNSPEITNYIDDSMSYSSNQFDENITSKKDLYNYPIKFNEPQIKFSHNNDIISSFIKPDGHFTHFEKQSKPNNFDEQTQQFQDSSSTKETTRKILNRDEELFLECCSLLKSGSEISSVSKKSTKQIPLNNFSDKNWTEQKQNYIPRESYSWLAQNSRVETPIGEPYVNNDWSNSNSGVSSEWLVKTSSPDHPVENNTSKKNINGTEGKYQTIHFEDISLDSSTTRNTEISPAVSKHVPENIPLDFHHVNFEKSNLKDFTEDDKSGSNLINDADKKDESVIFEEIDEEKEKKPDVPMDEVDEDLKRHVVTAFGGLMAKALKSRLKAVVRRSNKAKERRTLISALQPVITNYGFPIKKSNLDIDLSAENNSSDNPKKIVTKGAMKVFEGIKVSIPTQDLNLPEVLKLKTAEPVKEPEKSEEPKPQKIEKLILSKKKINKKKQLFKRFGNKLGLKETKKNNNKRMKIDKNKPHDVYDFDDSQENSVLKTNLSDFRNYRKDTTDKPDSKLIDESESETDRYYDSISFEENSISSESVEQNKFKNAADKSLNKDNQKKCMIMGRIFKNASKPKLEDKIPEIRDISSEENSKLVETYLESFDSFDNVGSTVEPLNNHGLTIINSANKMSKHEMDQLFDKLLEDNTKISAETKEMILKEKAEKKDEMVKPKVQRVNKKRQRHHSEDSTSTDEFTLHGRQTKSKKHKKHPRKPNSRRKNNGGINLEQEIKECIGVAGRKSQRKCTSGKQNVLAEFWSSDESEIDYAVYCQPAVDKPDGKDEKIDKEVKVDESDIVEEIVDSTKEKEDSEVKDLYDFEPDFDEINEELPRLEHNKEKPEHLQKIDDRPKHKHKKVIKNRRYSKTKDDSEFEEHKNKRKMEHKRKHNSLSESSNTDTLVASRRKRNAVETLYYWSSTSDDDDVQDLIEVKPIREDTEDDRPMQHGWIVGDSPKKLVTMLAQAKVLKKNDCESVKEQGKKNRITL